MTSAATTGGFYHFPLINSVSLPNIIKSACVSFVASNSSIFDVDRTMPVIIENIVLRNRRFRFTPYIELSPTIDETGELLCLEYKFLGIQVFAESRNDLQSELAEQICMLWDEYACEDDDNLSPAAIELKRNLLGALEEV